MSLRDEILEQPQALRRQLAEPPDVLNTLAAQLRDREIETVVIAARGTSDHAAIYGQYVLGVRNGLVVGLATPSIVSLYGVEPRARRSLVVGISQSGASPDIVGVVAAARRAGAPTLAITNDPRSPLAEAAEHVLDLAAGPERAVAATKTYTTSLLAIARLSLAIDPDAAASAALAAVPDAAAEALGSEPAAREIAAALAAAPASLDRCVIVGRGFEYATAREWSLKLKELARVFADPYSAADFRHGPIALVQPGIPVLVLAPSGATAPGQRELLDDLAARGVDTVVLSDDPDARALGRWSIPIPAPVPEWLRPIVSIVPAQLFAYHATVARGLDPDAPRYIAKVTRTT
jgi:glucosamine--fructose-6-phosphate aminotransferase (isomerizing)